MKVKLVSILNLLLPKMGAEDLDERNLQSWNFAVQENTSQV